MPNTESKIVKLIDGQNTEIQASVRQVGAEGALLVQTMDASSVAWDDMTITYLTGSDEIDKIEFFYNSTTVQTYTAKYDGGRFIGFTKT